MTPLQLVTPVSLISLITLATLTYTYNLHLHLLASSSPRQQATMSVHLPKRILKVRRYRVVLCRRAALRARPDGMACSLC